MKILTLFAAHYVGLFCELSQVAGNCNANSLGTTECVLLTPYYQKKQWATCLTNAYIKQTSSLRNKNHRCRDIFATICWYQCMVELNDLNEGPVYDNCTCDSSGTTNAPISQTPTLPTWCYSPTGESCSWYRECLEKAHPCEGQDTGYAIEYAEKFCNLYDDHYEKFSANGQKWIDLVRKCLQVKLVPLLRPWIHVTCEKIRDTAFASHSKCYVNPENKLLDEDSFCELSTMDQWRVFWTIKSGFVQAPKESLSGLLETVARCRDIAVIKQYMTVFQISVKILNIPTRQKRFASNQNSDKIADDTTDAVANQLSWSSTGIMWYAYADPSNRTVENVMTINILLASKKQLDLNDFDSHVVNLNDTIDDMVEAVEHQKLKFPELGVTISSFKGCKDFHCNETYVETISPVNINIALKANTSIRNIILVMTLNFLFSSFSVGK